MIFYSHPLRFLQASLKTVQEIKCFFHCCCQEHLHANWEDCLAEKEMYWMAYWEMCTFENWILNWVTSEGSGHKTIFCWVKEFSIFRVCSRFHLNAICSVISLHIFWNLLVTIFHMIWLGLVIVTLFRRSNFCCSIWTSYSKTNSK